MKPPILVCLAFAASLAAAATPRSGGELEWPEITAQTKPWSRWWWLGNIGTPQDFTTAMEQYAKAGLGGLEITPIYGVRGEEERFRRYLSPEWMKILEHVLDEGQRLGLGIDMSTGTGWPFGGPWVSPDMAARHVVTKTYPVKGGTRLSEPVGETDRPIVRGAGKRRLDIATLRDPVTANPNLQELAIDQVRFPRKLELQALVAYGANGEKVTLTERVGADGRLDWTAPAGSDWTLYALFMGWHGKQVERAGPGGEGDVIDHFSSGALARYLQAFDRAYEGFNANRLRAYFNDSYEVDDASGESNWTPQFFTEFQQRRGYDLREELPAFLGRDTPEKNARVRADHRETISDLLLDGFTRPWAAWAKGHGALVRNQAHGSPANIIDLYAASDIPETEGTNIIGMKLASSAAHLTGKPLTSAETATWLDEHWTSTLGDIKRRVDLMFLGGVNHNCYHGTVFSPPGEPWPGHHFYASVELDPSNSIWADADVLNTYVARCQSFLQNGRPAHDLLLYYPIHDTWAHPSPGKQPDALPHFKGGSRPGDEGIAQELYDRGYTFDFVTDRLLAGVQYANGALRSGGAQYRVVVVPETKHMPAATLQRLAELAAAGAKVVFHRGLPADVPGWGRLDERRRALRAAAAALRGNSAQVAVGDDLNSLLSRAGVGREALVDHGLQFVRRTHERGQVYFLINRAKVAFAGWLPLGAPTGAAALFDPMSGRSGWLRVREVPGGGAEVYLQLAPNETCLVKTFAAPPLPGARTFDDPEAAGEPRPIAGPWTVTFVRGGPTLPSETTTTELRSWTELPLAGIKAFAGTARYRTSFDHRGGGGLMLDLGQVADSCRVRVNGREVAALIDPPWRAVLRATELREGENTLEVLVTNLAANRVADLDRQGAEWKRFYNVNYPARIASNRGPDGNFSAAKWAPRASGLLGPVTLTPMAETGR